MVLFSCNLPVAEGAAAPGVVERKDSLAELGAEDLNKLLSHWNPTAMRKLMEERFAAGARLWLLRWNSSFAAYGWTLAGKTMDPHFFPLGPGDVHFFDFLVFPEFRGRGLNPSLVNQMLAKAGEEAMKRAYIEAAAWNMPQLSSLKKTPFKPFATARKLRFGRSTLVFWGRTAP